LKTYYEGIYNAGYTKVLSQVTIMTPQGKFPIPDFFFCKTATDLTGEEVLNLADIIYHDSKLYAGTAFTTAQKQIEQVMKAAKAAGIKAEFVLGEDLVFEGQTYLQGTKISIKEMSKVATEVVNGNVELTRTVKVIVP